MGHGWGTRSADRGASWLSAVVHEDILPSVTKRLVDVDDEKLEAVRCLLGTQTLKATVAGALDEVLALDLRRKELLAERGAPPAALADPDERDAAWG